MTGAKGIQRIIRRGLLGPTDRALKKTFSKHEQKIASRAEKISKEGGNWIDYSARKRFGLNTRIAVSEALSAIGLNQKIPQDRYYRGLIHNEFQNIVNLSQDLQHPDKISGPERQEVQQQVLDKFDNIDNLVRNATSNEESVKLFKTILGKQHAQIAAIRRIISNKRQ
ncbi:MAG: hypothetical protein HYW05_02205 [Candidatus Diapherotrites archaeon]|nr:hypothetical protein [Candidatus Diapherotrites archaeon]